MYSSQNKISRTRSLAQCALGAVLISICSQITIPLTVPFTLQTFAIFLVLLLLGGRRGLTSIAVYVLLGCVGLPVFSGFQGGIGHILQYTGGYITGFLAMGLLYIVFEKYKVWALSVGLCLCYAIGTVWFACVAGMKGNSYSVWSILCMCVLPYILPDAIKMYLAVQLAKKMRSALNGAL